MAKGSQATCHVRRGMGDCSGAKAGNQVSSRVDFGYTELFCVAEVSSVLFLSGDSVLGDTLESIKHIEVPYVFDREHVIALHAMQGNQASSLGEGEVSWFSSSCGRNLGYILGVRWGWPFKTCVYSVASGPILVTMDTSEI